MTNLYADTPDNQRGTVSAQQEIGHTTGDVGYLEFDVPANARSILIVGESLSSIPGLQVLGKGSGLRYPALTAVSSPISNAGIVYISEAIPSIDPKMAIQWSATYAVPILVIADQGIRLVNDNGIAQTLGYGGGPNPYWGIAVGGQGQSGFRQFLTDDDGRQYVLPGIPPIDGSGHPPVEVKILTSGQVAGSATLTGSPGASYRYRIIRIDAINQTGDIFGYVEDGGDSVPLLYVAGSAPMQFYVGPTGYAMSSNASINFVVVSGSGNVALSIYGTTEQL